jgi:hypothetical protein
MASHSSVKVELKGANSIHKVRLPPQSIAPSGTEVPLLVACLASVGVRAGKGSEVLLRRTCYPRVLLAARVYIPGDVRHRAQKSQL